MKSKASAASQVWVEGSDGFLLSINPHGSSGIPSTALPIAMSARIPAGEGEM